MIVIHIDSMEDTAHLKHLYEGLDGITLLYNESREKVEEVLKTSDDNVVMCLGHGSGFGLFGAGWHGYVIDIHNAHLLKDKKVIGIWCYASTFADRTGLSGYFTSMFISNLGEAKGHGFPNNTEEDIFNEIDFFCDQIKGFIQNGTEMSTWVPILQEVCHKEKDFVRFNYEAMAYFENSGKVFDKENDVEGRWTDDNDFLDLFD